MLERKVFLITTPPRPPARLKHLDEVLKEEESGLARADGEVLLNLFALTATEGRIGEHNVETVPFLNVRKAFGERVGVDDVRHLDAVQDHVHDRDDISQRLLFLPEERASWSVLGAGASS